MFAVNAKGKAHAQSLIKQGKVNRNTTFTFSISDGNKLLGPNEDNYTEYAKWHIGDNMTSLGKDRYKYPIGKNGFIYRKALTQAKIQALGNGDTEIAEAVTAILNRIDNLTEAGIFDMNPKLTGEEREFERDYRRMVKKYGDA